MYCKNVRLFRSSLSAICVWLSLSLFLFPKEVFGESHPIWPASGDVTQLTTLLAPYLQMNDSDLQRQIDTTGRDDPDNLLMVDVTYDLSRLYGLTNNPDYARRTVLLLDRFREVFPVWVRRFENAIASGEIENIHASGSGIWSDWFHVDLEKAQKLAEAFDLVSASNVFSVIGSDGKERIKDFLIEVVKVDLTKFRLYLFNLAGFRPRALMVFGRVVDDPELFHLGFWYYNKMLHEQFSADGFHQEGSHSYHFQLSSRLTHASYETVINGYSDPPGYFHIPFESIYDSPRFINLSATQLFSEHWRRMTGSWNRTTFPNGTFPITNETSYNITSYGRSAEKSYLLGGIGHAVLSWGEGNQESQARLDFSPSAAHFHRDANHLIFFSRGKEVIGGTGYLEGDREWNTSTLNQNLVVVDGKEQKANYWLYYTDSPYVPGLPQGQVRSYPFSESNADGNLHNNLLMFEPGYQGDREVQLMEVDSQNAYRDVLSDYQRLIGMIHIQGESVYLLDFFRLQGGAQYDWVLHGGHDPYTFSTPHSMNQTSETFGAISLLRKSLSGNSWSGEFNYGDVREKVHLAGAQGTTFFMGKALSSTIPSRVQDYLVVRRNSTRLKDETFMAVHEAYSSSPSTPPFVEAITPLTFQGAGATAVGLQITLRGGIVDYVVHNFDAAPPYVEQKVSGVSNFSVKGRFAHVRVKNGAVQWMKLFQGEQLSFGSKGMRAVQGDYSYRGVVSRVLRKERGEQENAFEVNANLPVDGSLTGKTIIVTWGNGWKWGYTVKEVRGRQILVDEEPGFDYNGSLVAMRYFPVGNYPGPVTFLISGNASLSSTGVVVGTSPTQLYTPGSSSSSSSSPGGSPGSPPGADAPADDPLYERLQSKACAGANGFLGQINIASVVNFLSQPLRTTVSYRDANGVERGSVRTTLPNYGKQDFIINDLGLLPNSYGTVCVSTDATAPGGWTGGITIYRLAHGNQWGESFDYALNYPFTNPQKGKISFPLNTFHLGTDPRALVTNWISITDATKGDEKGLRGKINYYDQRGDLIASEQVSLPDGGRFDYPAHKRLAPNNENAIGLAQFLPTSAAEEAPPTYYATLTRYFFQCPPTQCADFRTAFVVPARPPMTENLLGGVSTMNGELSVLELNNFSSVNAEAQVKVYNANGGEAGQSRLTLPPLSSNHLIINRSSNAQSGYLAPNAVGSAVISAESGQVSATALFYKLDSSGRLLYGYPAPLSGKAGLNVISQFNTYIEHQNVVEVQNASPEILTSSIMARDTRGAVLYNSPLQLAPWSAKRFVLPLPPDIYGTVTASSDKNGASVRIYTIRNDEYVLPLIGLPVW